MNKPTETEQSIVHAYQDVEQAKKVATESRKRCGEAVKRAEIILRESMESGVMMGDERGALVKLREVEVAWQELTEAKAYRVEVNKLQKETLAMAKKRLQEAVEASKQITLLEEFAEAATP